MAWDEMPDASNKHFRPSAVQHGFVGREGSIGRCAYEMRWGHTAHGCTLSRSPLVGICHVAADVLSTPTVCRAE